MGASCFPLLLVLVRSGRAADGAASRGRPADCDTGGRGSVQGRLHGAPGASRAPPVARQDLANRELLPPEATSACDSAASRAQWVIKNLSNTADKEYSELFHLASYRWSVSELGPRTTRSRCTRGHTSRRIRAARSTQTNAQQGDGGVRQRGKAVGVWNHERASAQDPTSQRAIAAPPC